ncbi:hypothetical protein BDY24DRAFT_414381 [Mrakia frigida]|uniref:uncharacterized protein n=1 Tax=Mrakia frigida TaxID=29902 RepID=UPI003FCC0DA1
MVLDFSSVPAMGVDVEQAFSVSSHLTSKRRHRLNNSTAVGVSGTPILWELLLWDHSFWDSGLLFLIHRTAHTP